MEANDALEYVAGKVHAVIYNISEKRCATQEVEIGRMAFEGGSTQRMSSTITMTPENRPDSAWYSTETKKGKLVPFESGDRLEIVRVERGDIGTGIIGGHCRRR